MRASSRALAWAGGLVLLFAALVAATSDGPAWLDVDGPPRLEAPDRRSSDDAAASRDAGGDSPAVPAPDSDNGSSGVTTRTLAVVILVLALIIGAAAVIVGLRLVSRGRSLDPARGRGNTAELEDEPDPVPPDVLVHEIDHGLRSVAEGGPRNAIVATWIRLEEATVAAGFDPRRSETPAEFVRRALDTYDVDQDAIGRLADLYREARFSEHPLTEAHRDDALRCLRRLHGQLTRVSAR